MRKISHEEETRHGREPVFFRMEPDCRIIAHYIVQAQTSEVTQSALSVHIFESMFFVFFFVFFKQYRAPLPCCSFAAKYELNVLFRLFRKSEFRHSSDITPNSFKSENQYGRLQENRHGSRPFEILSPPQFQNTSMIIPSRSNKHNVQILT